MTFDHILTQKKGKKRGPVEGQSALFQGSYRIEPVGGIGSMAASLLPKTDWVHPLDRPTPFPSLRDATIVSLDTETKDPHLHARGPGFVRGDAEIVGASVSARWSNGENFSAYYPIRHRAPDSRNIDPSRLFDWMRDQLSFDNDKLFANRLYDLEGFAVDGGFKPGGRWLCVQNAEGILDEESAKGVSCEADRGFALDKLGRKYVGAGKFHDTLEIAASNLGIKNIKSRIADLPPSFVGAYAEADAALPLQIWDLQKKEIERENLGRIWDLETDLGPLLLEMRLRGVRVDVEGALVVSAALKAELDLILASLAEAAGRRVDPWDAKHLERLCEARGVPVAMTKPSKNFPEGQPSFTADWLKDLKDPIFDMVRAARKIEKLDRDFVRGVVADQSTNGRIHTQFHQLKRSQGDEDGDEDGTRSGRLSSTHPNLQQMPIRDPRLGLMLRGLFLPEEGGRWYRGDWSAQEHRLLIHFAVKAAKAGLFKNRRSTAAALEFAERYHANPMLDPHQETGDMAGIERKYAKPVNLMTVYGAGPRKIAWKSNWITEVEFKDRSIELPGHVKEFFDRYHDAVPFVKELMKITNDLATARGWVSTLLGRRGHFELWQPRRYEDGYGDPLPLAMARKEWPDVPLKRADTRKGLNRIIQGSAADQMKETLRRVWLTGRVPAITMHDELGTTVFEPSDAKELFEIMVNSVPLEVPMMSEVGIGDSWGGAYSDKTVGKEWLAA